MINTLWSIRTEALMLEECLSTVTVSSLTGEVKDVLIDEVVRFSGEDNSDEVENARENCGGFHNEILSGLSSVIHFGCLGKPMDVFVGGITTLPTVKTRPRCLYAKRDNRIRVRTFEVLFLAPEVP